MPLVAGLAAAVGQPRQMLLTVQRDDVGRRNDFDIRMLFQPLDQIFGHRLAQARTAENDMDLLRDAGEIDRSLTRRIARSDDRHLGIAARSEERRGGTEGVSPCRSQWPL